MKNTDNHVKNQIGFWQLTNDAFEISEAHGPFVFTIFCYLRKCAGNRSGNPSIANIALKTGIGRTKVLESLTKLDGEYIRIEKTFGAQNEYTLLRFLPRSNASATRTGDDKLVRHTDGTSPPCGPEPVRQTDTEKEPRKTTKKNNSSSGITDPEPEDLELARWMFDKLRALNPSHSEPNFKAWSRDIRLMRERDNRSHEDIKKLFSAANSDVFWCDKILSPSKLRQKFDQLTLKFLRSKINGNSSSAGLVFDPQAAERNPNHGIF